MHVEAQKIDLNLIHHEGMEPFADRHADQRRDGCEHDVFSEDVSIRLARIEAEHLDGRNLADTLCDVDVGQVVQHNECQSAGADHDQDDDVIQTGHHIADAVAHILCDADRGYVPRVHQLRAIRARGPPKRRPHRDVR